MAVQCPNCSNEPRSFYKTFLWFSMLSFKCQYCNEWMRGYGLIVVLDVLSVLLSIALGFGVFMNIRWIERQTGDWSWIFIFGWGLIMIKGCITWLQMRFGEYELI